MNILGFCLILVLFGGVLVLVGNLFRKPDPHQNHSRWKG